MGFGLSAHFLLEDLSFIKITHARKIKYNSYFLLLDN
jgi:hypothetical protein